MYRDIIERHQVKNTRLLKLLIKFLFANNASLFSMTRFHNSLKSQGIKSGRGTLFEYFDYLEECYLFFPITIFSNSEKQKVVNPRKVYSIDMGLTNAYLTKSQQDTGHLLENLVFLDLLRQKYTVNYFMDSHRREIDFFCKSISGEYSLIQVCADLSSKETEERELRMFDSAANELQKKYSIVCDNKLVVTLDTEKKFESPHGLIRAIPVWKFLLDNKPPRYAY